jgi:hypothetical protein
MDLSYDGAVLVINPATNTSMQGRAILNTQDGIMYGTVTALSNDLFPPEFQVEEVILQILGGSHCRFTSKPVTIVGSTFLEVYSNGNWIDP